MAPTPANPPAGGYTQFDYKPAPANTKYNRSLTCANCEAPAGAAAACVGDQVAVLVAERRIGGAAVWANQGTIECLTPTEQLAFDPAELQAMVDDYFQRIPLPKPGLHISPADNAVVNLPEIVSADALGATAFTINEAPFPTVLIKATVRWEWDFGDGGSLTTTTPGKPYSSTSPDIGGYLTHTYLTANEAWPITVTSVWTGTYTVAGMPGTRVVTGAVQRTSTVNVASADYSSTLTGN